MEQRIQAIKSFIAKEENRTKIAAIAGVTAIVTGIATYAAKRGIKRK